MKNKINGRGLEISAAFFGKNLKGETRMETTVTEKPKIDELKTNLATAEQNFDAVRAEHAKLEARRVEIRANLPGLKMAVEDAEKKKTQALDAYVSDESKLPELEKAREVLQLARKTESETLEILAAVDRALPGFQQKIVDASNAVQGAKHEYWNFVSKKFADEARAKVGDLIEKAWAMKLAGGGAGQYEYFLSGIFPKPNIERIQELQKELK